MQSSLSRIPTENKIKCGSCGKGQPVAPALPPHCKGNGGRCPRCPRGSGAPESRHPCFLDFSKAFDCINLNILVTKLVNLGVRKSILPWICSFLSDRKQRVKLGNSVSEWATVNAGVSQGTKLGPILFLVMVNDLIPPNAIIGCMLTMSLSQRSYPDIYKGRCTANTDSIV